MSMSDQPDSTTAPVLQAITYNLHKGRNFITRRSVLKEVRKVLVDLEVDILFLQEAMGLDEGMSHLDQLADSLGFHSVYGQNNTHGNGGHYGNAILSRYPVEFVENRNISTNRFERRGSLHAKVDCEGTELLLYCLHLDLLEAGRAMQIQNVVRQIRHQSDEGSAILVAGDFNDWRERVCQTFERELKLKNAFHEEGFEDRDPRSFPSFFPSVSLDRFYFRNLKLKEVRVLKGSPWNRFSDHCPVFADFSL